MVKFELGFQKYVPRPEGPVYYDIMNSDAVQNLILNKAKEVARLSEDTGYNLHVDVRPGHKRAHAYVLGTMYNPHSWREKGHVKKWGKRLDAALQRALDSISE